MQPDLSYLYDYPVEETKEFDDRTEFYFSNGAILTIVGTSIWPLVTNLNLLTSSKPDADHTLMKFGRSQKNDDGTYTIQGETDFVVDSIGYSIQDPRWPEAGDCFPEIPVPVEEPTEEELQWDADRTAEGPDTPA